MTGRVRDESSSLHEGVHSELLGGSWVGISGVISPLIWVVSIVTGSWVVISGVISRVTILIASGALSFEIPKASVRSTVLSELTQRTYNPY